MRERAGLAEAACHCHIIATRPPDRPTDPTRPIRFDSDFRIEGRVACRVESSRCLCRCPTRSMSIAHVSITSIVPTGGAPLRSGVALSERLRALYYSIGIEWSAASFLLYNTIADACTPNTAHLYRCSTSVGLVLHRTHASISQHIGSSPVQPPAPTSFRIRSSTLNHSFIHSAKKERNSVERVSAEGYCLCSVVSCM